MKPVKMSERKNQKPKKFRKRSQDNSSSSSSSSESTSSQSSDDESSAQDLKPIKEYLTDRRELARQLFIAVKGEKLRMMLPQVLKKMELVELEEWCANELSGMSKARILSILNGQPLLQSSDSSDTDDSGPSLEIISDTEEWEDGSDVDGMSREEDPSSKKGVNSKKDKTKVKSRLEKSSKDKAKPRCKLKGKVKTENDPKLHKPGEEIIIKKENELEQSKEKDGESLLDLLELEMRARAIRALIRKEEDIIPTNPLSNVAAQSTAVSKNTSSSTTASLNAQIRARDRNISFKVVQDKLQELGSSFRQSEGKGIANKTGQEISEEEDVVLVLQPTTTIELLSSESDGEGGQGKRRNQRLENERVPKNDGAKVQGLKADGKIAGDENRKSNENNANGITETPTAVVPSSVSAHEILTKTTDAAAESASVSGSKTSGSSPKKVNTDLEKFRKLKKTKNDTVTMITTMTTTTTTTTTTMTATTTATAALDEAAVPEEQSLSSSEKGSADGVSVPKPICSSLVEGQQELAKENKTPGVESEKDKDASPVLNDPSDTKKVETKPELPATREIDEDKSTDLEIVIDLDDYPDDMEELENIGTAKTKKSNTQGKKSEVSKEDAGKSASENGHAAETWATRYYQTEDVQSVIKESKIQSEIRKRLRERQRLARLNNSPGLNAAQPAQTATILEKNGGEKEESSTTGSVEEYMALKNVDSVPCADSAPLSNAGGEPGPDEPLADQALAEKVTESPASDDKIIAKTEAIEKIK